MNKPGIKAPRRRPALQLISFLLVILLAWALRTLLAREMFGDVDD